ncbi:hypothetical protein OMCYN_01760 [cyanobiont of Ornithocercus magnificus]|nr:hypothetical protein OMCYN_01760 [cyanobiont of Ornithocercus magnificus]
MSHLGDTDDSAPIADRHLRNISDKRGDLKIIPVRKSGPERFVCEHVYNP